MVSFFNDFIDLICFKSLHPTWTNSYEQNKYYHLHIEWWISNLAGVIWLRSTCMQKNQEGFLRWKKLELSPPWISLKTDLNHNDPMLHGIILPLLWASSPKQLVKSMWDRRAAHKFALDQQGEGCSRRGHLGILSVLVLAFTLASSVFTAVVFKIGPFILKDPKDLFKRNKRVVQPLLKDCFLCYRHAASFGSPGPS